MKQRCTNCSPHLCYCTLVIVCCYDLVSEDILAPTLTSELWCNDDDDNNNEARYYAGCFYSSQTLAMN